MQKPKDQPLTHSEKLSNSKWRIRDGLTIQTEVRIAVWSGTAVRYWRTPYTQAHFVFADSTHGLS